MHRQILATPGTTTIAGAPEGYDALVLGDLVGDGEVLFVARDDVRAARTAAGLAFFAPAIELIDLPAWDCLPYDRVSPHADILSRRVEALTRLLEPPPAAGRIVMTTVSGILQKVPPRTAFANASLALDGGRVGREAIVGFLAGNGYVRAETVMEAGEYAVRGDIIDVFPPGREEPLRLDFFGDEMEGARTFEATTQRTTGPASAIVLKPVSEVPLDEESVARFRSGYRETFGAIGDDPLYEAISAGRRHMGSEHWLPLFYDGLETIFDYVPEARIVLDHQADEARDARLELIAEYFQARRDIAGGGLAGEQVPYKPLQPDQLYLDGAAWEGRLQSRSVGRLSPFAVPDGDNVVDAGGRPGHDFADVRVRPDANVFDAVRDRINADRAAGKRSVVSAFTEGSRARLSALLEEHGVTGIVMADDWSAASSAPDDAVSLVVLDLEHGFATDRLSVIGEQDILGDRLTRPSKRRVRAENFIAEASSLAAGDLVVHVDHGIGRYDGLETIAVAGAPHDCLRLVYAGDDKLFLPVENIELISRYGTDAGAALLDRLGGAAWQARKSRLKKRIKEMADELIRVAATRAMRAGHTLAPPEGLFEEFCARFPYAETEDQRRAIETTNDDLASGQPMDRLICGDVGFGKTEVALRAAFISVMAGKQVAVVVPTTLLARQHDQTFRQRFAGYPVQVAQLSRLVSAKKAGEIKAGLVDGTVDIVIGTHALLAKSIAFRDLGLLVVDEEQHFGVAHKERLKALKADVHVLTLTATPIPRTLQMALAGVRDMSLIATPPVDRLAVRTFVLPHDPVVIREAILREHFRGGQTFYVCPRISDLDGVIRQLADLVPDIKVATMHGQMPAADMESVMAAFYEGSFDVLVSTNIIESGLDLPAVNTIIIHRADMFGLAQLYQLRGRVGRSKTRAYAYLTLPPRQILTAAATKRLEVMQALDSLGAGFTLASHDLDIRGAGNLLGGEQSGHIREVGIELYQQMLEEAVAEARSVDDGHPHDGEWSPQISIGIPVLIPDYYVADLGVRLGLYRRIAGLSEGAEIESFAAEMIDRFGPVPAEVENLLQTVAIKRACLTAGVDRVEAGPKGATVAFRNNHFTNPDGLVAFITEQVGTAKLRPDHTLVYRRAWDEPADRLAGVRRLVRDLAAIAGGLAAET